MSKKNRTEAVRVPPFIRLQLFDALNERQKRKLISRKENTSAEAFKLIGRMPEWKVALEKLKKLPKREDLF